MGRCMEHLKAQGCRSVGVLGTAWELNVPLYGAFRESVQLAALSTRNEWIRHPSATLGELNSEAYGYHEFMRFWNLPEKPDALIVFPDSSMRGVLAAILELGWRDIVSRLKLILHRNAHANYLCPFPALWAVSNEDSWADALLQMVEDQYEGRTVTPVSLPFEFRENVPPPADAGLV